MTEQERDLLEKAAVFIGFLVFHPNYETLITGSAMKRRAREFLDGYDKLKMEA